MVVKKFLATRMSWPRILYELTLISDLLSVRLKDAIARLQLNLIYKAILQRILENAIMRAQCVKRRFRIV